MSEAAPRLLTVVFAPMVLGNPHLTKMFGTGCVGTCGIREVFAHLGAGLRPGRTACKHRVCRTDPENSVRTRFVRGSTMKDKRRTILQLAVSVQTDRTRESGSPSGDRAQRLSWGRAVREDFLPMEGSIYSRAGLFLAVLKMIFNFCLGPPSPGGSRGRVRTAIFLRR